MLVRFGDLFEFMGSCFAERYEAVGFVGAKGQLRVLDRRGRAWAFGNDWRNGASADKKSYRRAN